MKYRPQNIDDIFNEGFRNVRLRSRADLYSPPYDDAKFEMFLTKLEEVVDKCLEVGVAPIISWINHKAEAVATETELQNYLTWWRRVAEKLKRKSYHLSFNLFTELGIDECGDSCENSLTRNNAKYNQWTREVISVIRATGERNMKRILIITSPKKTSNGLSEDYIDEDIYIDDSYIMIEWHDYAAGPNKKTLRSGRPSRRFWAGSGSEKQRQNLRDSIQEAQGYASRTNLLSYFGAWMPRDNKKGELDETEVINFAKFFVNELKIAQIPWSLNVLDDYYDTKESRWLTLNHKLPGGTLNVSRVLQGIKDVM